MIWFKKRQPRIDPDTIEQLATESLEQTDGQKEEVSRMTKFLELRKDQNHFGEEFHVSFRPKEAR